MENTFIKRRLNWITSFREKWDAKNVSCWIYYSPSNGSFVLNELRVPEELRSRGIGSEFMNELIHIADKKRIVLYLTPSLCYGATSLERLEKFYERFGFKKKNKDMVRNPKGRI